MILSAQRVLSTHGIAGINTYVYRHPSGAWDLTDLDALAQAALLVSQELEVPPGGNAIRSYLDVFAPEGTEPWAIVSLAQGVRTGPDPSVFPFIFQQGSLVLRFGLINGLVLTWRQEFTELVSRVLLAAQGSLSNSQVPS